jgi:hypothetical protein
MTREPTPGMPQELDLVESRGQWRHVYYRIASTSASSLVEAVDRVLEDIAESMAACALPEMPTDSRTPSRNTCRYESFGRFPPAYWANTNRGRAIHRVRPSPAG